ncbi:uncharacterized protein [Choristoneura fumiferana]|uniref:uncharacterized protein n=1 Tax=Choristoneura fumiferana TaxID=7141 RepID=UPI003D1537F8
MNKVKLSTVLKSHLVDEMNVDTKLAEQYLKGNKAGFTGNLQDLNNTENLKCVLDSYGNKIYCDLEEIPNYESKPIYNRNLAQYSQEFLEELAQEMEKKCDLFCQLEYLIRKIPINDTKQSINLIARYLQHTSESIPLYPMGKTVLIENSTPLLFLGSVSQLLVSGCFTLIATKETAVICHLFTELCQSQTNCPHFIFRIRNMIPDNDISSLTIFDSSLTQITGIITEKSDIDSAVRAFLDADYSPFTIRRIVVQESVYEEFKSIIAWNCKSKENECKKISINIELKCTDVFRYKKKLFLLDFADEVEELDNEVGDAVLVEAYRTTTELLSLINKSSKRNCISLWVSGVSEANEISLNIDAPFIWINSCYNFDGPDEISRVLFQNVLVNPLKVSDELLAKLTQKQLVWSKKSFFRRCKEVLNIINTIDAGFGTKFEAKIQMFKMNNSVSVVKNTMILCLYDDHNILGFTYDGYMNALKALVNGHAIIIDRITDIVADLFKNLAIADIPVVVIEKNDKLTKLPKKC